MPYVIKWIIDNFLPDLLLDFLKRLRKCNAFLLGVALILILGMLWCEWWAIMHIARFLGITYSTARVNWFVRECRGAFNIFVAHGFVVFSVLNAIHCGVFLFLYWICFRKRREDPCAVFPSSINKDMHFVGRNKEIREIGSIVNKGKIPLVYAAQGTGKKALAYAYALRKKEEHAGGALLANMQNVTNWKDAWEKIRDQNKSFFSDMNDKDASHDGDEIRSWVLRKIKKHEDKKYLLILVDFDFTNITMLNEHTGAPEIVNDLCGLLQDEQELLKKNLHVIATSQFKGNFSASDTVVPYSLHGLSVDDERDEARLLMQRKLYLADNIKIDDIEKNEMRNIADYFHGHIGSLIATATKLKEGGYGDGLSERQDSFSATRDNMFTQLTTSSGAIWGKVLSSQDSDVSNWYSDCNEELKGMITDFLDKQEEESETDLFYSLCGNLFGTNRVSELIRNNLLILLFIISLFPPKGVKWCVLFAVWHKIPSLSSLDLNNYIGELLKCNIIELENLKGQSKFQQRDTDTNQVYLHWNALTELRKKMVDSNYSWRICKVVGEALQGIEYIKEEEWDELSEISPLSYWNVKSDRVSKTIV